MAAENVIGVTYLGAEAESVMRPAASAASQTPESGPGAGEPKTEVST
jgi:hypothetical protein